MPTDLRERLEIVIELAPKLRESGVSWIDIDGIKLKLTPHVVPISADAIFEDAEKLSREAEAADENATYGLPPGAKRPGFERPSDIPRKATR